MNKKVFIGIDNGVSGTIGVISDKGNKFIKTPVFSTLKYTKKKANITRVNHKELYKFLQDVISSYDISEVICGLERPMVNPTRFNASASALRAFESTLIVLENLDIPYFYIDSKEWQKNLLPKGIKGNVQLKRASLSVGNRLFPEFKNFKHSDRDGILIAEHIRKKH